MELIFLDRDRGHIAQLNFSPRRLWIAVTTLALCFFSCAFYVGWRIADVQSDRWSMREALELPVTPVRC